MKQLILERTKTIAIGLAIVTVIAMLTSSCASMRTDCQGNKHQRLPNGIYL